MEILEPAFLGAFLNHLERDQGICIHSRNVRLAAIYSFFSFVAFTEPSFAALAQRVLAIPNKRFDRRPIRPRMNSSRNSIHKREKLGAGSAAGKQLSQLLIPLAVEHGLKARSET